MQEFTVYADPKTERIEAQANDHLPPHNVIIIDRCATSSGAAGIASWHRDVLNGDRSVPFADRVRRAQTQVDREARAIHQAVADGEPSTLRLEERQHPAVLAALAMRP